VKSAKKINNKNFLILILFLFATSFMSLKTFKNVYVHDIKISGSKLFTKNDLVNNSSLKFPTRLLFIKTNFLEKELKQNLSLKNISVSRQIFPFGLNFHIQTRTPIAYGEKILNDTRILGFVDKDGIFIEKQNLNEKNWGNLTIEVVGWKEKFKKILSKIFISQNNYEFEIVKIIFSQNGFLTVEEKDLKTIFLGFNQNLIHDQLKIINNLKIQFRKNNFSEKIDNIDLTNPDKPKIKVFKP
jgi:cell division protein FtsQ